MSGDKNPLEAFIGTWSTSGEIRATDSSEAVPVEGTDRYEWLIDRDIILHRVDVRIGSDHVTSAEIIGHNKKSGNYFMHSYDANGDAGVMQASVKDKVWTFQGETLRFTGGFSEDNNTFSGVWEQAEDGRQWASWMDIRLERRQEF